MKNLLLVFMLMSIFACNGGGGGSSTPSTGTGGSSGGSGGSGGSTSGGDGNASYYGFNVISNTPISDTTAPADTTTNIVHAGEFYAKISNASARVMDLAIYQPTCLLGGDYAYYSALNMNSDTSDGNAVSALVTSSSITFYRHKFNYSGRTRFDEGTAETVSGTCTDGEFVLDGGLGSVFSNGKMIVAKLNNTLYFGVKSSLQITSTSTAFDFTAYSQTDDTACSLDGCIGGGSTTGVVGSANAYSFTNGAMHTYFGDGTLRLYTVGGGLSYTSHMVLEGAGGYAPTLIADIGSKKVVLISLPHLADCPGATPVYCTGSSAISIGLK